MEEHGERPSEERPESAESPRRAAARKRWAVPLGELVAPCLGPAAAKQGFAAADVVLMWSSIVGARLAQVCEPVRLQWPPKVRERSLDGMGAAATLVVRVEGAFALELQHMTSVVVERVNAHLGWRCVGKLALRQAPLQRAPVLRHVPAGVASEALARAEGMVPATVEAPLREALTRLGAAVLATRSGKP